MKNEEWYEALFKLYEGKIINEDGLNKAVSLGWIDEEEKILIIGECAKLKLD